MSWALSQTVAAILLINRPATLTVN